MCQIGDIIVIDNYNDNGKNVTKHSFVIISDEAGQIQGLDYDFICNVLSSFKDDKQKEKKLKYLGNFPITHDDTQVIGNKKDGYVKAEQFYYFKKDKINYIVIGKMKDEVFNLLIDFINGLDINIEEIIDNL